MSTPNPRKLAHQPTKSSFISRVFSFTRASAEPAAGSKFPKQASSTKQEIDKVGKFKHGQVTETGSQHRYNEDRGQFIQNLFTDFPTFDVEYAGTNVKDCTCITVFDGHGGSGASDHAVKNVPRILAELIWKGNFFDLIGSALYFAFKKEEEDFYEYAKKANNTSGACALCVVVKGNQIFCGCAGDSKALFFASAPGSSKALRVVSLNDRYNTDNEDEVRRIRDVAGKKAITADGAVFGMLYPTRGFGDLDVKAMAPGVPVILSTPDGAGIGENEPVIMDHSQDNFIVVASDGVWDFIDDSVVVDIVLQNQGKKTEEQLAKEILETSRAHGSEDDITVIVVKVTF